MIHVGSSINWWSKVSPEKVAIIYQGEKISYSDLNKRVEKTAAFLKSKNIKPTDVVGLIMKNSTAYIELALAVSFLGAVLLPINFRLSKEEVAYISKHAEAKLIFADTEFSNTVPNEISYILLDEKDQKNSNQLFGDSTFEVAPEFYQAQPHELYRLMYTSGTTDRPKGVMHSYNNAMWRMVDHIAALRITYDDSLLVVGPLYHVGAYDLPGVALLTVGGTLVIERDFNPENALALIDKEKITGAWMAPVMLNRILSFSNWEQYDLSSLKWLVGGGERTPEERIRSFTKIFKHARYVDAYGLTETCSGDTMMEIGREIEKIGSTGRTLPHVKIAIKDDDGRSLPPYEFGEVCIKGPKVTSGYWKDPEKTAQSFHGGWFRSGDVGYLDEDGFLYLTDRKKDMIISGGENIASSEVERVIYEMDKVSEVAVIGVPDPQWGECVMAVVVLHKGETLTLDELRGHCLTKLGNFKTPKKLICMEALPRNPSGKVLKRELRKSLV